MFPWFRPTAWLLAGAEIVTLTGPATLPLAHRDGDPRPVVHASVEDRPMDVVVDPFGPSRVGRIAAIRLGLDSDHPRVRFDARLGAEVELVGVRAQVVDGEEVVLGLGTLPQVASALDAAAGTLTLVRPSDADDLGPLPSPLARAGARRQWPSGPVAGDLDAASPDTWGDVPGTWHGGRYRASLRVLDPRHPLPVVPATPGRVGGDALATLSWTCGPAAAACRFDPAPTTWTANAEAVEAARRRALAAVASRAATWTVPEPPEPGTSVPSGDPGGSWQATRWLELSDAAWQAGQVRRALVAAGMATRAGRDRCEPWVVLGERLLRGGSTLDALDLVDVASPDEAASFLGRAVHHLRLHEEGAPGYTLSQPASCRRAQRLADEAALAEGASAEALTDPVAKAVASLRDDTPEAADAQLRAALARGRAADVDLLVVHLLVQQALGREVPVRATLARLAEDRGAHTLWVGVVVAEVVGQLDGEEAVRALASDGPAPWRAAAGQALGAPRPTSPMSLDDDPWVEVPLRLARHPGDPTSWALARWLGHDVPQGPPSIDAAIVAAWLGDPDANALLAAWPVAAATLAHLGTDPPEASGRTMHTPPPVPAPPRTPDGAMRVDEVPKETTMIPVLTVAAALAADFDHTHAAFGEVLKGAVSTAGVDYGLIGSRRDQLDAYLETVAEADASGFDNGQQLALYVNAYNAYTIQTMLDAGPGVSILDLDGGKVWDKRTFEVAGQEMTLNQMEHDHARRLADGRVHAVVNCASKGCPPLPPEPLKGSDIDAQLTAATKTWASHNAFRLDGNTVALSKIFDWYGEDFANVKAERDLPGVEGKQEQALWFLSSYVDEATRTKLLSGEVTATWAEYDWSRNAK